MYIQKLTITPLVTGCSRVVIERPSKKLAQLLINEKLNSKYSFDENKVPKALRKISKSLKGFVNPESKVPYKNNFIV